MSEPLDPDALTDDELDALMRAGTERTRKDPKDVTVLECPDCGRSDLSYVAALETGHKYGCPHCGYEGAFVIERERSVEELRREAGLK